MRGTVSLVLALVVLGSIAGCGATSPAAPTTPPAELSVELRPGTYVFAVTPGTGPGPTYAWSCMAVGSFWPSFASVDFRLERSDTGYTGRALAGTLQMDLRVVGNSVSGTLKGTAPTGDPTISLSVGVGATASFTGTAHTAGSLSGSLEGKLSLVGALGSYGCSAYSWSLSPL